MPKKNKIQEPEIFINVKERPEGKKPFFRHTDIEAAIKEAKRLADLDGGMVMTLKIVGVSLGEKKLDKKAGE